MKKILTLAVALAFFAPLSIQSLEAQQTIPSGLQCGTTVEDLQVISRNMLELRDRFPVVVMPRAVSYIPVYFHLVSKTDGTGHVAEAKVLDMLCGWNAIYANNGLEMQFYLKGFTYISSDALYDAPRSFSGYNKMAASKKTDGMNIFLTNNCGDGTNPNEIVLAYYSNRSYTTDPEYANDWIVCNNNQVSSATAGTIAHEAGHLFSLPHTFNGFECNAFHPTTASPCAPLSINCNGVNYEVEKADASNGNTAGDYFSDTPADYNFGITEGVDWRYNSANPCVYNGIGKDPSCAALNPSAKNLMSYFLDCISLFSAKQKVAIQNNYLNHAKRAYLRNGNITPSLVDLTAATLTTPAVGSTTVNFNNFNLAWNAVSGATGYIVDISKFASFLNSRSFLTTAAAININSTLFDATFTLSSGTKYYWRVRAYNTYKTCNVTSTTSNFTTGTANAVAEIQGISQFVVAPNPLSKSAALTLNLTSETAFEANVKLLNVAGQLVFSEKRAFTAGSSAQNIAASGLQNGIYILQIESAKGVLNKKIVVQD